MTNQPATTTTTTTTTATARQTAEALQERVSLGALLAVLVITNVWFFSQALTYVH